MKKLLVMSLLLLSLTGCGCGNPFVECRIEKETEYVLPPEALLEIHPRPRMPKTSKPNKDVSSFVELLKGTVKKYETDKALLNLWKKDHSTNSSDTE